MCGVGVRGLECRSALPAGMQAQAVTAITQYAVHVHVIAQVECERSVVEWRWSGVE